MANIKRDLLEAWAAKLDADEEIIIDDETRHKFWITDADLHGLAPNRRYRITITREKTMARTTVCRELNLNYIESE